MWQSRSLAQDGSGNRTMIPITSANLPVKVQTSPQMKARLNQRLMRVKNTVDWNMTWQPRINECLRTLTNRSNGPMKSGTKFLQSHVRNSHFGICTISFECSCILYMYHHVIIAVFKNGTVSFFINITQTTMELPWMKIAPHILTHKRLRAKHEPAARSTVTADEYSGSTFLSTAISCPVYAGSLRAPCLLCFREGKLHLMANVNSCQQGSRVCSGPDLATKVTACRNASMENVGSWMWGGRHRL